MSNTDNVLYLRPGPNRADAAQRADAQETERRALVKSIREAAADPSRKLEGDDPTFVARAVDRLFADARAKGIKQQAILKELGRDSQIHLERFRADHEAAPAEVKKLGTKHLSKNIADYISVIEAVARLLSQEIDEALADAFMETRFFQEAVSSTDDPAVELKFLINAMIAAVVRVEGLSRYFELCRNVPAVFDPVTKDFLRSGTPMLSEAKLWPSHTWLSPALPGVTLARVKRGCFSGPLSIEAKLLAPGTADVAQVARLVSPLLTHTGKAPDRFSDHSVAPAEATLYTEIRLVIGPVKTNWELGPRIELRSFVELSVSGRATELSFPHCLSMLASPESPDGEIAFVTGSVAARFEDGWHRVTGVGSQGWEELLNVAPNFGLHQDTGLHLPPILGGQRMPEFATDWIILNTQVAKELLQLFSDSKAIRRQELRLLNLEKGPFPAPLEYRFFGCPFLERGLHTGAIEQAVRASCALLRTNLEKRAAEYHQTCTRMSNALIERWRSLGQ